MPKGLTREKDSQIYNIVGHIIDSYSKQDILQQIQKNYKVQERQAYNLYAKAEERLGIESKTDKGFFRNLLLARYNALLRECEVKEEGDYLIEAKDRIRLKKMINDSIKSLTGLDSHEKDRGLQVNLFQHFPDGQQIRQKYKVVEANET
jgi:hypothetical protein